MRSAVHHPSEQGDPLSLGDSECRELFRRLFPQGLGGADVRAELAPEGWPQSPLLAVFHPSVDQVWQERIAFHENLENLGLGSKKKGRKRTPAPTREEVVRTWEDRPIEEISEVTELMGLCLWDVFSNNNEVIADDGRVADLGSFRGSAGFIADVVSEESGAGSKDYLDYYLGSIGIGRRATLIPVYQLIFRRLKMGGCDWHYSFPRLYAFSVRDLRREEPEPAAYSASEAFECETKQAEADAEHMKLLAELEEIDARTRAEARLQPAVETVAAYKDVFGRWPAGWPP
jgi:hypothetical protein